MSNTNPFAGLLASRGPAYRQSQISELSHYDDPIVGTVAGNSHVWGDASATTWMESINALIQAAGNAGLDTNHTALLLSIVRVESGLNPSAAAGTTSASGLGQLIDKTGASFGLTPANMWDVNAQAQAAVDLLMYSLIVTAKMNDIDPQVWLADVLARIAEHPVQRLDDLLPWNWRKKTEIRRDAA
jgi:IS66 C-terminal element/Transglycosylase SLT domain